MTNIPPNPPPDSPESSSSLWEKLANFVKKPSTLIVGGVLLSLGVAVYGGVNYFVYQKLSPLLSTELSKLLEREVLVGDVESFAFNYIRIGTTSIPTTETDPDRANIEEIIVRFNPLPILIGQPLSINVTVDKPNLYLEQDKQGEWVKLPEFEEEGELNLPIDINANIELSNAEVSVLPNGFEKAVEISATGTAGYGYRSNDDQEVLYDLKVNLLKSDIVAQGTTNIKTWKTEAQLRIDQLALPELVALIPNLPVTFKSGLINSDLNVSLPSLEGIEGTQGQGNFDIYNVEGSIQPLKVPLKLNLGVDFVGKNVQFKDTQISLGDAVTQIQGSVNWEEGYNVDVDLEPLVLTSLLKIIPTKLPVDLGGEIQGKIRLRGEIKDPIVTGTINNTKPLLVAQTPIQEFKTVFQANLDKIDLKQFQIKPTAGGEIVAAGNIEAGILKAIQEDKKIDWQKMPVALGFQVQLPSEKLVEPYYKSPQNVSLGPLTAQGKIGGNLGEPKGKIEWRAPNVVTISGKRVSGKGEVLLTGDKVLLRDTTLNSNGGNISLKGVGNIKQKQWQTLVTADRFSITPLVQVACSLITCPEAILTQTIILSRANINVSGKLDDFSLESINSRGNLALNVDQGAIALNTNIAKGKATATARVSGLALDPYVPNLSIPVQVARTNINLSTPLKDLIGEDGKFNINPLNLNGNARLTVAGSPVNANLELSNGILKTVANTGQIALNPFIPNLPVQSSLVRSNVTLTGNLNPLIASLGNTPDLSSFQGNADIALAVDGSRINATGTLNDGMVRGVADISQLSLNDVVPNLPIAAQLVGGNVTVSSQVTPLLSTTPNLSSAQATVDLRLATAEGTINALTRLQNNQWNTKVTASDLNPSLILSQLVPDAPPIEINDLNAQATLSGSLNTLFESGSLPIQANNIAVTADGQTLNANGDLLVSNLLTQPDAQINLSVDAKSNLDSLPLTQLLAVIPVDRQLLPEELQLRGTGEFTGKLVGQNLLTAPTIPGNIRLFGDVELSNFAFNDRTFETLLTGKLNATLGQAIALNLRGTEDVIAASLEPCTRQDCPAPYLPASFELRQIAGDKPPIIVTGQRRGDELVAKIEQFPLDIFKIAPGKEFGIPGFISGDVETEIVINPFTLEGRGKLTIDNPSVGLIKAKQITADVIYEDNLAQLRNATLSLGESLYALQGSLDLNSGAIDGRLNIDQGRVQDLLTALKVSNVERLLDILQIQPIDYATAADLPPQSVGEDSQTIAEKVNLLAVIDQKIRELAKQRKAGGVPTELDIRGSFDTEVALGGTIYNPQVNVEVTGNNWEWHPQPSFPNIIEPLGLVIRDQEFIPISQLKLNGTFANNTLTINPAKIQIKDTILALEGQFSLQQIAANWQVNYLSLDTINNFIQVPLDANGALNASGTISGSPFDPQLQGQFALVDAGFQGKPLNETVAGQFSYQDARFKLLTNESSIVYASIDIPFPTYAENDQFAIDISLETEALELVSVLTREQVLLTSGEGEIRLQAKGRLDLSQGLLLSDLDAGGMVTLDQTVFESAALPEPLTVSGNIAINDEVINVQQIQGTFADSTVNIAGILPIFQPQTNLENPLTVAIEEGQIDLQGLYRGLVDGRIMVTGSAIQPVVGGDVRLANGTVLLPPITLPQYEGIVAAAPEGSGQSPLTLEQWTQTRKQTADSNKPKVFIPKLDDLNISLRDLSVSVSPIFNFEFGGDVTVNGFLDDLNALEPEGSIVVSQGNINFLETRFLIERRHLNQIVFSPQQGLFNPALDLQLRTIVSEVSDRARQFRAAETTEIPDDSLNKVQRVDINLALNGSLSQLIPSLGKDESQACQIQDPLKPINTSAELTNEDLEKVANCLQILAAKGPGTSDQQLLSNPVVKLTSSPPRSQGQIVSLLGEQLFVLAEALQGQSTEQLIQFGIVQLALPMVFQNIVYNVETTVSDTIGSTDFRIVPFLEAIYEVEDQGFVRLSYDYGFNEFRVKYEKRF
ncbi:MAG: translocation/assembly module TamB domain-containing protein [Cyanobacteria bacterium P01_G01_bin.49]